MVLTKAGAITVPMDGKSLTLAKLTGDPAVTWHGENDDLSEGMPTFGAVELQAKTVTTIVRATWN